MKKTFGVLIFIALVAVFPLAKIYALPINMVMPVIITLTGGLTFLFKDVFKDGTDKIMAQLESFKIENNVQHKEVFAQIEKVRGTVDYLVNTRENLTEYSERFSGILQNYIELVSGDYKTFMITKHKSITDFIMKIHSAGFYTLDGVPIKQDMDAITTQLSYEMNKINTFGESLFKKSYQDFKDIHTGKARQFKKDLFSIMRDDANAKHQRVQFLAERFIKNTLISIVSWSQK